VKREKRERILRMLKDIVKYASSDKPIGLETMSKIMGVPKSTLGYYRKKLVDQGFIKKSGVNPNIPVWLFDKSEFYKLELISKFIDYCKRDNKNHTRYTNPLFKICQSLQIHPKEFIVSKEQTEDRYLSFLKKFDESLTDERYRKALRKFSKYAKIQLDDSKIVYGASDSKGDYATVHLTDDEITACYKFMNDNLGPEWMVLVGVFNEMFPRPDVAFKWKPSLETQYVDVDGKSYEIGAATVYEPKQEKYYDKLILDPRVYEPLLEMNPNKTIITEYSPSQTESIMAEALRLFYESIGKIEKNDKGKYDYEKGTPGWLYSKRPIYTLRHSSATMWLRRLAFNAGLVATMGWEDPKTLTTFYARNTTNNILQAGICYWCRPPIRLTDKAVFCSATHCAAYLYKQYGGKA
jgi:DNA-binding Lrp family transcriptional regulator